LEKCVEKRLEYCRVLGSLEPVLTRDVVSIAVRAYLARASVDEALNAISARSGELYRELSELVTRSLALGFVRESFWAGGGLLDEETPRSTTSPLVVRAWLLAKASMGRVGLPSKPWRAGEQATREIVDFTERLKRNLE
jgi:predicted thioredoxin/glutaredoxin